MTSSPTHDDVVEAAVAACRDPRNRRYTPAGGSTGAEHAADGTVGTTRQKVLP